MACWRSLVLPLSLAACGGFTPLPPVDAAVETDGEGDPTATDGPDDTPDETGETGEPDPIPTDPPATGTGDTLMIVQVADVGGATPLRWISLFNPTQGVLALGTHSLNRRIDGKSGADNLVSLDLPQQSVASGASWVIVCGASESAFADRFGRAADLVDDAACGDGDDSFLLTDEGRLLDVYGSAGVAAEDWAYEGRIAVRKRRVGEGSTTFKTGEWEQRTGSQAAPWTR